VKNSIALIKEFFSIPSRPVTPEELKKLTAEDRKELADAIAAHSGYEPVREGDEVSYRKVA
jgi:hypothetical protein